MHSLFEIKSQIHDSDMFGVFIEMGFGSPISSELCEVSGASKTVFYAENPYSDKISRELYDIPDNVKRLVSLDAIHQILNSPRLQFFQEKKPEINTILVASFQLGEYNDVVTHGYVGLKYKNDTKYYHITINESLSRKKYIELIKNNCMQLLLKKNEPFLGSNVDAVWRADKSPCVKSTLNFNNSSQHKNIFYVKNGKILRLEDLLRTEKAKKGLIVYKGSFNPITPAHEEIAEIAQEEFQDHEFCFSISLNTFGKEKADDKNVEKRIEFIDRLGYGTLVCQNPYFDELHLILDTKYNTRQPYKDIVYVMGMDTAERLRQCGYTELSNRKFMLFEREQLARHRIILTNSIIKQFNSNISSSEIRKTLQEGKLEKLKLMVSDKIIHDLIKYKELFV